MFIWDNIAGHYTDAEGTIVSDATVRSWVDDALALLAVIFRERTQTFLSNVSTEAFIEWNKSMRDDIELLHLATYAVGFGGVQNVPLSEWTNAEAIVKVQHGFWDNFIAGIIGGTIAIGDPLLSRSVLYASAGYATFQTAVFNDKVRRGYEEYKNVLGDANHCEECPELTSRRWQPIGSMPPIGARECMVWCRCHFEYRVRPETQT